MLMQLPAWDLNLQLFAQNSTIPVPHHLINPRVLPKTAADAVALESKIIPLKTFKTNKSENMEQLL